jgi:hypothetical protein
MRRNIGTTLGGLALAVVACLVSVGAASAASAAEAPSYAIWNFQTGQCLQPASRFEAAPIVLAGCNGTPEQQWVPIGLGNNHYRIVNKQTHFCFNAFDGAFSGGRLLQIECVAISNEEWNTARSLPSPAIPVKIESRERFRDTGICVDVHPDRVDTILFQCNGTQSQAWFVR